MPELPEVEVTRMGIATGLTGATVLGARAGKPLRWPLGHPPETLAGRRILAVRRRGKYLLLDLDPGLLLIHLGMSGSLRLATDLPAPGPHDHFDMETNRGTLRLHDPRRFGAVVLGENEHSGQIGMLLGKLGVEPLGPEFTAGAFALGLRARTSAIKQVLLSGELVVGAGNIYAAEALFHAGIRPETPACKIGPRRAARLHQAIRDVLAHAISIGGTTLRDFTSILGRPGYFQYETMVYGRGGEPCRVCRSPIRAIRQCQRATWFCPKCQKP